MLRSSTPFEGAEEDGGSFADKLDQWADAMNLCEKKEKQRGLKPGSLSILFSGKAITSAAGAEIAPPEPEQADADAGDGPTKGKPVNGKKNGHRLAGLNGANHG